MNKPTPDASAAAGSTLAVGSAPFLLGSSYRTKAGNWVRIVDETTLKGYECVQGDDGIWRCNRESDRGRVTASAFDMSDPRNLLPNDAHQPTPPSGH